MPLAHALQAHSLGELEFQLERLCQQGRVGGQRAVLCHQRHLAYRISRLPLDVMHELKELPRRWDACMEAYEALVRPATLEPCAKQGVQWSSRAQAEGSGQQQHHHHHHQNQQCRSIRAEGSGQQQQHHHHHQNQQCHSIRAEQQQPAGVEQQQQQPSAQADPKMLQAELPQDKVPQDKVPQDKVPQDKVPHRREEGTQPGGLSDQALRCELVRMHAIIDRFEELKADIDEYNHLLTCPTRLSIIKQLHVLLQVGGRAWQPRARMRACTHAYTRTHIHTHAHTRTHTHIHTHAGRHLHTPTTLTLNLCPLRGCSCLACGKY